MTDKKARPPLATRAWLPRALAAATLLGCLATLALGYWATEGWRRSSIELVERTLDEQRDLAWMVLTRDMRGAQASILTVGGENLREGVANELLDTCARLFAMYPYPESVFSRTRDTTGIPVTHVYNRAARLPPWWSVGPTATSFPVVLCEDTSPLDNVIETVLRYAEARKQVVVFETTVGRTPYQVVARLEYERPDSTALMWVLGFTVNLEWARESYFRDLAEQVSSPRRAGAMVAVEVLDERGETVAGGTYSRADGSARSRSFPLLFADPALLPVLPTSDLPVRSWSVRVATGEDGTLAAVARSMNRTFLLICVAVATMAGALALTARAISARARLATLKSDLLSALTHELKTPIASIQLASQTLVQGRYTANEAVERYARLLMRESSRLNRLVNNLLTFAALTDVRPEYNREMLHVGDLVDDALESLEVQVNERQARITVEMPADLPCISADRPSMLRAFENVIDNAIRYSVEAPAVSIVGRATSAEVHVWVSDQGPGIAGQDIARVFGEFARGRCSPGGGTGLGLAVASRIVEDHGGHIEIRSTPGHGTQVLIGLPAALGGEGHA